MFVIKDRNIMCGLETPQFFRRDFLGSLVQGEP
jgi:hypothetical protein